MPADQYCYLRPGVRELLQEGTLFSRGEKRTTRFSFADALLELGGERQDVVVLNADVSRGMGTYTFADKYPERAFNLGISEQNMIAMAAGMAHSGLVPFVATYAVFATLRGLDMIRNSVCYTRANVKFGCGHAGITPAEDGATHQGQEDLNVMRAMPHMTVIAPADEGSTRSAVRAAAAHVGPVYLSLTKEPLPLLYDDTFPFAIGRAVTVRTGSDATIVANRDMVAQALLAAELAAQEGLSVRVLDCHTVKPLDSDAILRAAAETGAVVTAEDNVLAGGLGSAVAELLIEERPVPLRRIGVPDTFLQSGPYLKLLERYGMSPRHILEAVRTVVKQKAAH
ncbi:MAG: transketolase family protein [Anaerolineae bacterium]|jgi:transketolase|nr:transketolase family protein [Chloroflexota bacterium]